MIKEFFSYIHEYKRKMQIETNKCRVPEFLSEGCPYTPAYTDVKSTVTDILQIIRHGGGKC